MKNREKKRFLGGLLIGIMLVLQLDGAAAGGIATVAASAATVLDSPFVQKIGDPYEPFTEGYYGYFPVRYEDGDRLNMTGLPALVKDGHTFLDVESTCGLLGISGEGNEKGYHITAWERDIYFLRDSAMAYCKVGTVNMEYTMPIPTVFKDGILWIPAEWLFWLTGGTFLPLSDGYVAVAAPKKNALDVLAEVYQDAAYVDYGDAFGMSKEEFDMWGSFFGGLDTFDGMMALELDKWMNVLPNRMPLNAWGIKDSKNYVKISDGTYASEVMDLILQASPDEAEYIQDALSGLSGYILETVLDEAKKAKLSFERLAEQAYGYLTMLEEGAYAEGKYEFAQRLGKYGNNRLNQGAAAAWHADWIEFAGWGVEGFTMAADLWGYYGVYENRDTQALSAARAVTEQLSSRKQLRLETAVPEQSIHKMEEKLGAYELGQEDFAVTQWFQENFATYIAEAVAGELAIGALPLEVIFIGYQLASRLNPDYMAELEAAEAFEQSLVAILYQQDIYPICHSQVARFLGENLLPDRLVFWQTQEKGFSEEELGRALELAYYYLKTSYVARSLATTAAEYIYGKEKCAQQEDILRAEVEQMGILSSCSTDDLPLPSVWARKAQEYSDEYLQGLVTPAYLHLAGSFVDVDTNDPIAEVKVEVFNQAGEEIGEYQSEADGSFDVYVPLPWELASALTMQDFVPGKTVADGDAFLPWKFPYYSLFAYPFLQQANASITLACTHPDYPKLSKEFSGLKMQKPSNREFPSWELFLDTKAIPLGVEITLEYFWEAEEYAVITAKDVDGQVIWEYVSDRYPDLMAMQRVNEVGRDRGQYYFEEAGTLIALEAATGECIWKNSELAGNAMDAVIDAEGNIYIVSFLQPDLFAASWTGETLYRAETLFQDYFWPYQVEMRDNYLIIIYSGGKGGDDGTNYYGYVNVETMEYSQEPPEGIDISDLPERRW